MELFVSEGVRTFYLKSDDGSISANPAALAIIKETTQGKPKCTTEDEVRVRALSALAEEARMMLDEGVVSSAAEIDLCMLLGCGWPLHLGGILPYLDREGISDLVCSQRFHPPGVASLPA